jgi:CRP/FNR family cyclic AMP-dependent transcriptional regulator
MAKSSLAYEYHGAVIETALAMTQVPLFAGMTAEALLPLASVVQKRALPKGEILCDEGDVGQALYVVIRGRLEVIVGDEVRGYIGAGEVAGEMALLDGGPRSATLRTAEAMEIYEMDREDLLETLDAHPRLAMTLLRTLARRILAAENPRRIDGDRTPGRDLKFVS